MLLLVMSVHAYALAMRGPALTYRRMRPVYHAQGCHFSFTMIPPSPASFNSQLQRFLDLGVTEIGRAHV